MNKLKSTLSMLATMSALSGLLTGGCAKAENTATATPAKIAQMGGVRADDTRLIDAAGTGIPLKDKSIIVMPRMDENRAMYERRLQRMEKYSAGLAGHKVRSLLTEENKATYDAWKTIVARQRGEAYNAIFDPISSWASFQMHGGPGAAKSTPNDMAKAQSEINTQAMIRDKILKEMGR